MSELSERLLARRSGTGVDDDPDACDDLEAFGCLRGLKERALMLDLRLRNGNREVFPYSLLERVSFDPSLGLQLQFLGAKVLLQGRNLTQPTKLGISLLEGLLRQRVAWIVESEDLQSALKPEAATVVTRIDITDAM
jgi:hypothetical protein